MKLAAVIVAVLTVWVVYSAYRTLADIDSAHSDWADR